MHSSQQLEKKVGFKNSRISPFFVPCFVFSSNFIILLNKPIYSNIISKKLDNETAGQVRHRLNVPFASRPKCRKGNKSLLQRVMWQGGSSKIQKVLVQFHRPLLSTLVRSSPLRVKKESLVAAAGVHVNSQATKWTGRVDYILLLKWESHRGSSNHSSSLRAYVCAFWSSIVISLTMPSSSSFFSFNSKETLDLWRLQKISSLQYGTGRN